MSDPLQHRISSFLQAPVFLHQQPVIKQTRPSSCCHSFAQPTDPQLQLTFLTTAIREMSRKLSIDAPKDGLPAASAAKVQLDDLEKLASSLSFSLDRFSLATERCLRAKFRQDRQRIAFGAWKSLFVEAVHRRRNAEQLIDPKSLTPIDSPPRRSR